MPPVCRLFIACLPLVYRLFIARALPAFHPVFRPELSHAQKVWCPRQRQRTADVQPGVCGSPVIAKLRLRFNAFETKAFQGLLAQQPTLLPLCGELLFSDARPHDLARNNLQRRARRYNLVDGNSIISILVIAACLAHRVTASHAGRRRSCCSA